MRSSRTGVVLRASWLATALAGLLAVVAPVTTRIAVERASARPQTAAVALASASGEPATRPAPAPKTHVRADGRTATAPEPTVLVHVRPGLVARAHPSIDARSLGEVAAFSKYYRAPLVLWVEEATADGRWGRVELPYVFPRRDGWIRLTGLRTETTWVRVEVDLSSHTVRVTKRGELLFAVKGATGAPGSPTPPGEYAVTDRVPFAAGGPLGSFAFGISGIQPRLPAGWTGGNQLAIHGTNSPSTIGQSVSAGCIRVAESALARLKLLLRLGTPVVIHA